MAAPTRRAALLLLAPFVLTPLVTGCADDPRPARPPSADYPPLRYGYLPPLTLNIQRLDLASDFVPPTGSGEVSHLSPVDLSRTLFAMARDRLQPVGTGGRGTFRIQAASITRRGDRLNGTLAVRLDLRDADGGSTGFAEARVTAENAGPIPDQRAAIHELLKSLMDEINIELEYQIKRQLRSWIVEPAAETRPVSAPGPSDNLPLPPRPPPGL